jgi:hypothetical protein
MRFSGRFFQPFTITRPAGPYQGTAGPLFTNAKAGKDAVEQVFDINHPDHLAKTVGGMAQIFCGKFGRCAQIMTERQLQRGICTFNGVPVPHTRDDACLFRPIGRNNKLAQGIKNGSA